MLNVYNEKQWKQKYGDLDHAPKSLVVVVWDDPWETPTETITRLNREVVELAAKLKKEK